MDSIALEKKRIIETIIREQREKHNVIKIKYKSLQMDGKF